MKVLIGFKEFIPRGNVVDSAVAPMNALKERRESEEEATHRECSECLSEIPVAASRCAFCTSELSPSG